jgi:hypothetical protein
MAFLGSVEVPSLLAKASSKEALEDSMDYQEIFAPERMTTKNPIIKRNGHGVDLIHS